MEERDLQLLNKHAEHDEELKALWEEHLLYEKQLEKLEKKHYLGPDDQRAVREIKKKKLAGKTRIQNILDRYREKEG